jgi:hypothetical protein
VAQLYSAVLGIVDSLSTANKDVFVVPAGHLYVVRTMLVWSASVAAHDVKFYDTARNPYFWVASVTTTLKSLQFEGRWVWPAGSNMAVTPGTASRLGVYCSGYDFVL